MSEYEELRFSLTYDEEIEVIIKMLMALVEQTDIDAIDVGASKLDSGLYGRVTIFSEKSVVAHKNWNKDGDMAGIIKTARANIRLEQEDEEAKAKTE